MHPAMIIYNIWLQYISVDELTITVVNGRIATEEQRSTKTADKADSLLNTQKHDTNKHQLQITFHSFMKP